MRLERIKALRWQGRSIPDEIKSNMSTAELQVQAFVTLRCDMLVQSITLESVHMSTQQSLRVTECQVSRVCISETCSGPDFAHSVQCLQPFQRPRYFIAGRHEHMLARFSLSSDDPESYLPALTDRLCTDCRMHCHISSAMCL